VIHPEDQYLLKSLLILGSVIEARDPYTGGHAWRVAQFAKRLADRAGLSTSEAFIAALGGYVHDLGKVGISDAILHKGTRLNADEQEVMRTHPEIGRGLLADHPLAPLVLEAIFRHHERFDGGGYPGGIRERDLAIYPRIVSVADAFDAMTSTRPYRKALSREVAVARLRAERDGQFDGALVDQMISLAESGALDGFIGHSDHGMPLVHCPACGPILAVPKSAKDGDTVLCRVCQGKHRLHAKGDTFEAEFLDERVLAAAIAPELEQIHGLLEESPGHLES
jgi:HD-GYP domain-containing protein (c-di-GMP phosphodiesterase class II)